MSTRPRARARQAPRRAHLASRRYGVRSSELSPHIDALFASLDRPGHPGGMVAVTTSCTGPAIDIRVTDTGRGIPSDRLESIFEPFVQIDSSLTREAEGVGLGLAISRELARGMGGELEAVSTLGLGSCFTLYLPAA